LPVGRSRGRGEIRWPKTANVTYDPSLTSLAELCLWFAREVAAAGLREEYADKLVAAA
jgi:hypothetical protein